MKKLIAIYTILFVLALMPTLLLAAPTNGLQGYWSGNGNALDQSGNGRNGLINGNVTYTTGKFGQAFHFTGQGKVEVADSPAWNISGDMTIALWVNLDTPYIDQTFWPTLISQDEGPGSTRKWMLYFGPSTSMGIFTYSPSFLDHYMGSVSAPFNVGEWHHIAMTKSGSEVTTYLDGLAAATSVFNSSVLQDVSAPLRIGWAEDAYGRTWAMKGSIDEVYFYNRSLSSSEISNVYGVPEPATLLLLTLGGLFATRKNRIPCCETKMATSLGQGRRR
jgi:hypothetical protein